MPNRTDRRLPFLRTPVKRSARRNLARATRAARNCANSFAPRGGPALGRRLEAAAWIAFAIAASKKPRPAEPGGLD